MEMSIIQHYEIKSESMVSKEFHILKLGKHEIPMSNDSCCSKRIQCLLPLYVCEFCLGFEQSPLDSRKHEVECTRRCPPGIEIYCKNNFSIFEVDGVKNLAYCKNLSLLSKLFTKQNTSNSDERNFLFYVLVAEDSEGCHMIGFFSKPNSPFMVNNLSSLLVLPPYQRKGFGRMLIDFSYLLTKRGGKVSSPERPLSELGKMAYANYWKSKVAEYMDAHMQSGFNIKEMSKETGMTIYDIVAAMEDMDLLKYRDRRYLGFKGLRTIRKYMKKAKKRSFETTIDPSCLRWRSSVNVPHLEEIASWKKGLITLHCRG